MSEHRRDGNHSGRPSKGPRTELKTRLSRELKNAAQARAAALGMTDTDYLVWLVLKDTGVAPGPQEGFVFNEHAA